MTPEMRAFEYALGLFSVLIGLAVADIATSLHRLLRSKHTVVWDPLALLAAAYALLTAVGMWFDLWGVRNVAGARQFFFYLLMVASLFVVFLAPAPLLSVCVWHANGAADSRAHRTRAAQEPLAARPRAGPFVRNPGVALRAVLDQLRKLAICWSCG